jgi:uncharacterized protein (TIGR02444 family)
MQCAILEVEPMENFWDYSVRFYGLPQVSRNCLRLQDEFGFDVNLLLFACWHGHTHGKFSADLLHEARILSQLWSSNLVQPLRQTRRWMKSPVEIEAQLETNESTRNSFNALREQIKTVELEAEKLQENILESLVSTKSRDLTPEQKRAATTANVRRLAQSYNPVISEELAQALTDFVTSVTPGHHPQITSE